ncbi:glycosyltransferase [Vibrio vulnificus]
MKKNKNQHLIVYAFASVDPKLRKDWQVEFYGSVSDQKYLADMNILISQYALTEQIRYCGATEQPYEALSSASICAFPSLNEGFPLAMTEAMSLGLAPIGLKSCSGVNQLIVDGHNGKLASTPDEFAAALEALMRDDELRNRFGLQAKEDVAQYSEASIWGAWERELTELGRLK